MPERATRARVLLAFAAVYLIWGSTYLAIRFAIETLPPFLMAGSRFLAAGTVLYAWARWRGAAAPSRRHWRSAAIVGGLLLLGGNGAVVWSEQRVASGLAALLVCTVPLWMVVLPGFRPGGTRPPATVLGGVALGLAGVALLVGPGRLAGAEGVDPLGALALIAGSFLWSMGSLYARRAPLPAAPLLGTAMEMLCGGALLLVAGLLTGEVARLDPAAVSPRSALALLYLTVFGSLVAFSAYVFLLRATTPARVSTYAFVNPVVAVVLGWAFAGEPVTSRTLLAAAVIVSGVMLITLRRERPAVEAQPPRPLPVAAPAGTEDQDEDEAPPRPAAAQPSLVARGAEDP
jgi:drug/metabolite transporter (DMT)-like permease